MRNEGVIKALKITLANSYVLYLKTQNYHWNVTGPNFSALHLMFQEQYTDLAAAVDLIAERIRALGEKAPGSFSSYSKLATIAEGDENLNGISMIKDLTKDQEIIIKTLTDLLEKASTIKDEVTVNIATDRLQIHEKNNWMLKSSI